MKSLLFTGLVVLATAIASGCYGVRAAPLHQVTRSLDNLFDSSGPGLRNADDGLVYSD